MTDTSTERTNRITSLAAIFVAMVSMVVALHESMETRQHNRLSVKPFLSIERIVNISNDETGQTLNRTCQLTLENRGLGPAIITAFELKVDNNTYPDWQSALDAVGSTQQILSSATLVVGDVINEEYEHEMVTIVEQAGKTDRLSLVIHYESVYGEPFVVDNNCDLGEIN